ncbi:WD40-repeat-containing domain protein [Aspergillus keveii]|uniref:WD40-repeat-containing domain protein n=1 Tax=Aspergillus keveii TaxID=714993 RepID=A0ABR4FI16_9EURO
MPTLDPNLYTVAWIAPLEIEVQAARHMLDKVHSGGFPVGPRDDYLFHAGEIHGHNVVIATFAAGQRYGTNSAASLASHIRKFFPNLWFGLLVGVAAGLPNLDCSPRRDIRLGDIIVAYSPPSGDPPAIVPYGLGKQKRGDNFELLCNGHSLPQIQRIVGSAIGKLKAENREAQVILGYYRDIPETATKFPDPGQENDVLYLSDDNLPVPRQRRPDAERTRVWYGSIGSGDQLLKSSRDRDKLRDRYNVIGLEMEAAGVMNEIPVGNIRGVCDYGDELKNKDWQPYAAVMAAAFAKAVLREIPPKSADPIVFTDEDKACLRDLLVTDPEAERRRIEATKGGLLDGSFRWALRSAEFQKWHSSPQSQLLWIKGDPGKGKTMLMIGIINELSQQIQSRPAQSIAYFLCQATDAKLNNATSILRSVIYMLVQQQPHLISRLRQRYDTNPNLFESENAFYSLSAIFENMIHDSTQATIYLLVDALDECESGLSDLLKLVAKTKSMLAVQVKWIVSSRNRDDIEQELEIGGEEIKLSLELNATQIANAVARNGILLEQVKENLLQMSDGTFLWVALVVQEMQKCRRSAAMVELLERTPQGLIPFYDRMLQQIQLLEGADRELCILVLSIVTLGYRPLHLQELCLIAGLQKQQYGLSDLKDIVGMCGSFLIVRDDYVYLIHQSAKDFLVDVRVTATIFPSEPSAIHYRIFRESLQALSAKLRRNIYNLKLDNPGISVSEIAPFRPNPDPLLDLRYSCTYWLDHLLEVLPTSADQLDPILDFLREHLLHWLESLSLVSEMRHGILALKKLVHQQQKEVAARPSLDEYTFKRRRVLDGARVSYLPVSERVAGYKALLNEFDRFATSYAYIIQKAPLQAYSAALAFCPQASESKKLYWHERLDFLERAYVTPQVWDPCVQVLDEHTSPVRAVTFSPDGQIIVSASDDRTVRLWDPATGVECRTLQGHTDSVRAVAFSPDGRMVATTSRDCTVRLWNPATGIKRYTLRGHTDSVRAVAFSPDGRMIASASRDCTVLLWDLATGVKRCTLQGHTSSVNAVAFSPDGQMVASASDDCTVRLWDPAMGVERCILQGHTNWVNAVAISPDGQTAASASRDHTVRLWNLATRAERRTLQGHMSSVRAVAFSPDGQMVASASRDRTVRLWDPATGVEYCTLQGHTSWVHAVAFSPDGQTVASASEDCTMRLWDPASRVKYCTLQGHTSWVNGVTFSPDGQMVASASRDCTVRLWDPAIGVECRTLRGHTNWVNAVAFSPDGQTIASASDDRTVRLWDSATGVECRTLRGHMSWVNAVAFSPDGQTVASVSKDCTMRLWDPATGNVKDKRQLDVVVNTVSFSTNGCLTTDHGSLSLSYQPSNPFIERQENEIFIGDKWVTRNGQRLIWLPPGYRATCAITNGNSVVLGHGSGRLTFLWLK